MHDDRTVVESRLEFVMANHLRHALVADRAPLTVEAWEVPGEPVPVAEALGADFQPFTIGSAFARPWGTTWFRMRGAVPAGWAGRRVETVVDLAFGSHPGFQSEALLWVEEGDRWVPTHGIHPLNHALAVADPAQGGEQVSYLFEAASNPTIGPKDRNSDLATASLEPIHRLTRAELVIVEVDAVELREDLRTLQLLMPTLSVDTPRRHEILRAVERALDMLSLHDIPGTAAAARAELTEVLSRPAHASAHNISAIGHAHIDSAWLWPLRETRRKCARTFANALALMDDYPEYKFVCSQAVQYDWMREQYPSIFEGIAKRVADGRWVPTGGMWVEPDTNVPSGESLVRQFTHGQRFFQEHFGVRCTEVWIPDVFGYTAALPQLARLAGIDRFLTQKLSWNVTNRFPHHTFQWEGLDGSTIFTHFPPVDTYGARMSPTELAHAVRNFSDKGRSTRSFMPFGFGDGGGGATRQMLEAFRRVRDLEGLPRVEIESPREFFDKAQAEYGDAPRWVGELYFEYHRGTYTSQARTKAGNRNSERLLHEAELWCTAAYGGRAADGYPADLLDRAWKAVLLHQFHDILPGSSIGWVHREAEETYASLATELEAAIAGALTRLAPAAGAVANAGPWSRREVVVAPAGSVAASARGAQTLASGEVAAVVEVPGLGLGEFGQLDHADEAVHVDRGADTITLSNQELTVTIGATDGLVVSCDAAGSRRRTLIAGQRGNLLQIHPDFPQNWDAWDLDVDYRTKVEDLVEAASVEVIDEGPLVARVRVVRRYGDSTFTQTYELAARSRRLDIHTEIDWQERHRVLKAAFPVDVHTDEVIRDIQFGHIDTKIHTNTSWDDARFEVCAHRFVAVAEPGFGVALLNDAKYGHDITRVRTADDRPATTMRLTLLKGAEYPDPEADKGHHSFTYALMPYGGVLADVIHEGYKLNRPLRVVSGSAAASAAPIVCGEYGECIVETVKPADDGSGDLIIRAYEPYGARTPLYLTLDAAPASVKVVGLLEDESADVPTVALDVQGATITGELRPFQVVTLRITR